LRSNTINCYIQSATKRDILLHIIEQTRIEFLLHDYYQLPKGFKLNLVDKSTINHNRNREFHSFLRSNCWVFIDDETENNYVDIYKTAIHYVEWEQLTRFLEKELLIVLNKCISVHKLFEGVVKNEFIQLRKLDNSFKVFNTKNIYLFTIIDKNTYIYYKTEEGALKRLIIQNTLSFLQNKLQGYNFFRTHKNFLINVDHLNDSLVLNSDQIKLGDNLIAKLSRQKQDDFINFLENL